MAARQAKVPLDVEEIHSTGKSLMPDGLEKVMTHQNLADLISYIRTKDSI